MNRELNDFCFGLILDSLFPLEFSRFFWLITSGKRVSFGPLMMTIWSKVLPHFEEVTTFNFKIATPLGMYGLLLTDSFKELPSLRYRTQ